jgi:carbamate kinase
VDEGVLVALGGNALVREGGGEAASIDVQRQRMREAAAVIAVLARGGRPLVVTHGNGPQVGAALERAESARGRAYDLPLDVCVAQTQGEIGYLLAEAIEAQCAAHGVARSIACVITRVVVDPRDPRMGEPTKPVGPIFPSDPNRGFPVRLDVGRGLRRVVASPFPQRVIETEAIRTLVESGVVVIAAGGGGIPVRESGAGADGPRGVEAVIDKDLTSAVLASALGLPRMLHLTAVEHVKLDFGTARERDLTRLSVREARQWHAEGHFAAGSMGPKIEGAIGFLERGGHLVDVASIDAALAAFEGRAGTRIHADAGPDQNPQRSPQ